MVVFALGLAFRYRSARPRVRSRKALRAFPLSSFGTVSR